MDNDELLTDRIRNGLRSELSLIDTPDDALARLRERISQDRPSGQARTTGRWRVSFSSVVLAVCSLIAIAIAAIGLIALHTRRATGTASIDRSSSAADQSADAFTAHVPGSYIALAATVSGTIVERVSIANGTVRRVANLTGNTAYGVGSGALSPDGRFLFYTSRSQQISRLVRTDLLSGRHVVITRWGSQPAISPNGRLLAYVYQKHFAYVEVHDLATGATRNLGGLNGSVYGGSHTLIWLDNANTIAIFGDGCPTHYSSTTCVTIAHLHQQRVSTQTLQLQIPPSMQGYVALSGDVADPGSLLLAVGRVSQTGTQRTTIYRITPGNPSATVTILSKINNALPETFDPAGRQLIIHELGKPGQSIATIGRRPHIHVRRLKGDPPSPYAW